MELNKKKTLRQPQGPTQRQTVKHDVANILFIIFSDEKAVLFFQKKRCIIPKNQHNVPTFVHYFINEKLLISIKNVALFLRISATPNTLNTYTTIANI